MMMMMVSIAFFSSFPHRILATSRELSAKEMEKKRRKE